MGGSHDLLQWVVGLQQQQRHTLFMPKTRVAAECAQLAGAGPGCV